MQMSMNQVLLLAVVVLSVLGLGLGKAPCHKRSQMCQDRDCIKYFANSENAAKGGKKVSTELYVCYKYKMNQLMQKRSQKFSCKACEDLKSETPCKDYELSIAGWCANAKCFDEAIGADNVDTFCSNFAPEDCPPCDGHRTANKVN